MRQSTLIADFAQALAGELRFDTALARRARIEVEDHLWEAVDHDALGASLEAQRRAIAAFGHPRELARQYVAASLMSQARRGTAAMGLITVVVFAAMKARAIWYELIEWEPTQNLQAASAIGLPIDRFAFALAFAASLVALVYINIRWRTVDSDMPQGKALSRCIALWGTATVGLLIAVSTETILTSIRLLESEAWASAFVPVCSLMLEATAAVVIVGSISAAMRRRSAAAQLFRN
jgi:hypothetical protein